MTASTPRGRAPGDNPPRLVVYHQTHHKRRESADGPEPGVVSLLPLLAEHTGVTHIIVAAVHLNATPGAITLNDDAPSHAKFTTLWREMAWLQAAGVKVLAMLGGAAPGTFTRLDLPTDLDGSLFEQYYTPLRDMIRTCGFDGIDLDIEEPMTLAGGIRLIDRLRADFGPNFLITLAPVATALLRGGPHLSGPAFDYFELERQRGREIAWYNTQFYNGWGDAESTTWYDAIVGAGWRPERVLLGVLTNQSNGGSGFVEPAALERTIMALRQHHASFGGVMGWEYFNGSPGGEDRPWEWVATMSRALQAPLPLPPTIPGPPPATLTRPGELPAPAPPFPAESIQTLRDLGFSSQQVIAALNMTQGNVEHAAALLFPD